MLPTPSPQCETNIAVVRRLHQPKTKYIFMSSDVQDADDHMLKKKQKISSVLYICVCRWFWGWMVGAGALGRAVWSSDRWGKRATCRPPAVSSSLPNALSHTHIRSTNFPPNLSDPDASTIHSVNHGCVRLDLALMQPEHTFTRKSSRGLSKQRHMLHGVLLRNTWCRYLRSKHVESFWFAWRI